MAFAPTLRPTASYPTVKSYPFDHAAAPFKPNDFVSYDVTNKRLFVSDGATMLGISFFGTKDGAFDGNGLGNVAVLTPDDEVELCWIPSTGHEAPADKHYQQYIGLTKDTDGFWKADSTKLSTTPTGTAIFQISEIVPARKNPTDKGAREAGPYKEPYVVGRFVAAALTGDVTVS